MQHPDVLATEEYLVSYRTQVGETFSAWKRRISDVDALLRGEFPVLYPGENRETLAPVVQNLADVFVRDVARMVSEARPTPRSLPKDDSDREQRRARIRAQVAETHWHASRGNLLIPLWAADLMICGAAFAACWWDDKSPYPRFTRLDPRACYPEVHNGELVELMFVQKMRAPAVERLFGITLPRGAPAEVEVWDYYCADEAVKAVAVPTTSSRAPYGVTVVKRWRPDIGLVPAAMVQLPSPDGRIVGMLDQLAGPLTAKNRLVQRLIDYMDQLIHAPLVERGVLNPEEPPGPETMYHLDPNVDGALIGRVQPAGSAPDVYQLLAHLDQQQHAAVSYPASRQGQVRQSIASSAFVASTQGSLNSVVLEIQRLLADLRTQVHRIGFAADERHLDVRKPLYRPVDDAVTYRPSQDIQGRNEIEIVYGAGAGLDRLNADVRLLQFQGAGIISRETVRANVEFLTDPEQEPGRIEREDVALAIRQRFLTDPNVSFDFIAEVLLEQERTGAGLVDAVKRVRERMAAEREQQAAAPEPPAPAPPPAEEQLALQRGEVPEEQLRVEFQPPPLTQILAGSRVG